MEKPPLPPPLLEPGVHYGVPPDVYRADPGYNQSALKDFGAARTPSHYRWDADHSTLQDKDFIRIGNYVDSFFFGGDMERFIVAPDEYPCEPSKKDPRTSKPWHGGASYCQEWKAQQEAAGKTVLTGDELARANGCIKACIAHEDCDSAIKFSHHQVVVIAIHPVFGYRMKGCIDMHPKVDMRLEWDFKTAEDASDEGFNHAAEVRGYHIQAKYYMNLLKWNGVDVHRFGFFVVENQPPHGVNTHYTDFDSKECKRAEELINRWLPAYHECVRTQTWPSYPNRWTKLRFGRRALEDQQPRERLL